MITLATYTKSFAYPGLPYLLKGCRRLGPSWSRGLGSSGSNKEEVDFECHWQGHGKVELQVVSIPFASSKIRS